MPYLLAAEADKIQDFVFRSSRLREITGASQLLQHFCEQVPQQLIKPTGGATRYQAEPIVSSGGAFRIKFIDDDPSAAKAFGEELAELYRLTLNSSIAVAEPVPYSGAAADFPAANQLARQQLRQAKLRRDRPAIDPHMPYVAFCSSCGIGLADRHDRLMGEKADQRQRYLCPSCVDKAQARWEDRPKLLQTFLQATVGNTSDFRWPDEADDVAGYDWLERNYVAYMVADGNGVGTLFSRCSEAQIRQLSQALPQIVQQSLAAPTKQLIDQLAPRMSAKAYQAIVPVLPLIIAGDDLFVLLSATYALDFARQFCLTFEENMRRFLDKAKIPGQPTMAAAIVICKSKYPYALAHRRGEELLNEAKRYAKQLATKGASLSTINFEVIMGNEITGQTVAETAGYLGTTLRPYWVTKANDAAAQPVAQVQRYGLDLSHLLTTRLTLKDLPSSRLLALRYALERMPRDASGQVDEAALPHWFQREIEPFIARASVEQEPKLREAFAQLGMAVAATDPVPLGRRYVLGKEGSHLAHGLLDLLESWGYAQELLYGLDAYDPQEMD